MTYCPEPSTITQGERVTWTRSFADYPATAWTLVYKFRGPSTGFDVSGTADGSSFDIVLSVAQTTAMAVGKWLWWAYVTEIADSLNVLEVGGGSVQVKQGAPTSTAILDTRTENEIALENINAALSGSTSNTVQEYEISTPAGSRRIKRISLKELRELQTWYQQKVNAERRAASGCGRSFLRQVRGTIRNNS